MFMTTVDIPAYISDGIPHPTNAYYGNSNILKPIYASGTLAAGTMMFATPGGTWAVVNNALKRFTMDDRSPQDIGVFERHHDPTVHRLEGHVSQGRMVPIGPLDPSVFDPLYASYRSRGGI
jgi:hypothetical protein